MRKITRLAVDNFYNDRQFKSGNTQVIVDDCATRFLLHGNQIAIRLHDDKDTLIMSCCGWNTLTTRERLNGLLLAFKLPFGIVQRKHKCTLIDNNGDVIQSEIEYRRIVFNLKYQTPEEVL